MKISVIAENDKKIDSPTVIKAAFSIYVAITIPSLVLIKCNNKDTSYNFETILCNGYMRKAESKDKRLRALKCPIVLNLVSLFLSLVGDSKIEFLRVCEKSDFPYFLSLSPTENFRCRDGKTRDISHDIL